MRHNAPCAALAAACLALIPAASAAPPAVSGTLTLNGKSIALAYAYADVAQPDEPIVVLSDQPLPPSAIPFVPAKLVQEKGLHVIAFSFSRKDRKLTNSFGALLQPGEDSQVGLPRVEDAGMTLTVTKLEGTTLEGKIATVKPVELSSVSYAFDLSFKVDLSPKK